MGFYCGFWLTPTHNAWNLNLMKEPNDVSNFDKTVKKIQDVLGHDGDVIKSDHSGKISARQIL